LWYSVHFNQKDRAQRFRFYLRISIYPMIADKKSIQNGPSIMRGYLLVIGMSIFWGLSWPIMKIALFEIPPWTFRTLSLTCGGIGVLILARTSGEDFMVPRNQLFPLLLVSALNVTGWHLGSAFGISYMQAGRAAILGFTMPLWASLASIHLLGEKISVQKVVGLILGLSGLFILVQPQLGTVGEKPIGAAFMLGAAISWGMGTVLLKYFKWTISTVLLTGWQLLIGSLPVVVGALLFDPALDISRLSSRAILSMIYVIAFPMLFCHWAYFTVVGIFPASVAAISTLAIPVIGVLSSALFLGESVGIRETAALVLVLAAVGIVLLWRRSG
jgi:drug/metabolite transporter (DMT)-like permease